MVASRPRGTVYAERGSDCQDDYTIKDMPRALREILKVLPLGLALPLALLMASVSPDDAASNLSKWGHWMGANNLPSWLSERVADNGIIVAAVIVSLIYIIIMWWVIPIIKTNQQKRLRILLTPISIIAILIVSGAFTGSYFLREAYAISNFRGDALRVFGIVNTDILPLGEPLGAPTLISVAHQAAHEHATIIWLQRNLTYFVLKPTGQISIREQDPDWTSHPENFGNERWLRSQFHVPVGKLAPFAGTANHWLKDPTRWEWIGWRDWYCTYGPDTAYFQEFERGFVVGIFRVSPRAELGEVFFILNDNSWYVRDTKVTPAKCGQ